MVYQALLFAKYETNYIDIQFGIWAYVGGLPTKFLIKILNRTRGPDCSDM